MVWRRPRCRGRLCCSARVCVHRSRGGSVRKCRAAAAAIPAYGTFRDSRCFKRRQHHTLERHRRYVSKIVAIRVCNACRAAGLGRYRRHSCRFADPPIPKLNVFNYFAWLGYRRRRRTPGDLRGAAAAAARRNAWSYRHLLHAELLRVCGEHGRAVQRKKRNCCVGTGDASKRPAIDLLLQTKLSIKSSFWLNTALHTNGPSKSIENGSSNARQILCISYTQLSRVRGAIVFPCAASSGKGKLSNDRQVAFTLQGTTT